MPLGTSKLNEVTVGEQFFVTAIKKDSLPARITNKSEFLVKDNFDIIFKFFTEMSLNEDTRYFLYNNSCTTRSTPKKIQTVIIFSKAILQNSL